MVQNRGVRHAYFPDDGLGTREVGEGYKYQRSQDAQDDGQQRTQRVHQGGNAWQNGSCQRRRSDCREQHVCQYVLIDEFGDNAICVHASEHDSTQHSIAIEPMGISAQSFVRYWISSIADVLPPGEVIRDDTGEGARSERLQLVYGCKVAREISRVFNQRALMSTGLISKLTDEGTNGPGDPVAVVAFSTEQRRAEMAPNSVGSQAPTTLSVANHDISKRGVRVVAGGERASMAVLGGTFGRN